MPRFNPIGVSTISPLDEIFLAQLGVIMDRRASEDRMPVRPGRRAPLPPPRRIGEVQVHAIELPPWPADRLEPGFLEPNALMPLRPVPAPVDVRCQLENLGMIRVRRV